jgi:hypothetical protein
MFNLMTLYFGIIIQFFFKTNIYIYILFIIYYFILFYFEYFHQEYFFHVFGFSMSNVLR